MDLYYLQKHFHDLIFTTDLKTAKFKLREDIINDIEDIIYGGSIVGYMEAKEGNGYNTFSEIIEMINKNSKKYEEPERTIAFLYEKELRVGIVGHIESNLVIDPKYKAFLKNNNYFGYLKLKDYTENVFGDNIDPRDEIKSYKILDPDGYTNLRSGNDTHSLVIAKINTGTQIEVLNDSGNWWYIQTKDGKKGYVHKSRIVSE
uniref:SH3 domain-containing protein n=1 Tax=Flavobacterium sp. TaxID=239 RepID=UPI00404735F8